MSPRTRLFRIAALSLVCVASSARAAEDELPEIDPLAPVNAVGPGEKIVPVNQALTPAGRQVELPGLRPQVLALSPDGRLLATSGKTGELIVVDPDTGAIRQRVALPSEAARPGAESPEGNEPDRDGQASYTGLVFSPDGSRVYLSNANGSVKVFSVDSEGAVAPLHSIPMPPTGDPDNPTEIPSGLAVSPDGTRLYAALNISNRLLELDPATGETVRTFDVGNAPYGVALAGRRAYVTNWGGRRPGEDDLKGPIGIGAHVRVDPKRFIASEGSVSVVDLEAGSVEKEIVLGLHASGLALSPDGLHLAVANANEDTVSVLDARSNEVVETIRIRFDPNDPFGASPNALAFDDSGETLFVCNGTQNAVAVVAFRPGESKMRGLVPTGWYPGAIVFDAARKSIHVANIKGLGSAKRLAPGEAPKFNSHQYFGTLSLIPLPDDEELANHTRVAHRNYRRAVADAARLPARPGVAPRPVPERVGEPSVFKHVVYVVKENRTYDQVLGDMPEGNGDPSLCIYGERVTPNQHKMCREFVLLDNAYCSGILSADGHQWANTAFATDYMEKSFAGFKRSYPDGMEERDADALAYASSGFIWDNAIEHGKTLRVFGEFAFGRCGWREEGKSPEPKFLDYYRDFAEGTGLTRIGSVAAIPSLDPYLHKETVGWNMDVPDVWRAAKFVEELERFEREGEMPNFLLVCLPNDHTSGTSPGSPTPAAQVADNDLAFGRIAEAIGKSRFWKETCIFSMEDDPQDGWDHVSGYRTTAYVVSPYTARGKVVSVNYNQTSILRTIELILGLPPMNQMDATATPMSACFVDEPNFAPFVAVPNNVPLDEMNPEVAAIENPELREAAIASSRLPLDAPDQCSEEELNEILWIAAKGTAADYPAWAIEETRGERPDSR